MTDNSLFDLEPLTAKNRRKQAKNNSLFDVEALTAKNRRSLAESSLSPATRAMLLLLAELDTNKEVIAALLEMGDMEMGHIRYIAAPVMVHRGAWSDTIPSWIFRAIAIDRLKLVFEEHDKGIVGNLVTPGEIVAVMMPASYEAPMKSRWVDVYLWACNEAMVAHNRLKDGVKDTWELIGCRPVEYKSIKHDYEELARDIRSKVVEAARLRGWKKRTVDSDKKQQSAGVSEIDGQLNILEFSTDETEESDAAPAPMPAVEQTNLFDLLG
ncbi:hypothetical protein [Nostoc sp. DedQUE07]|uniref:hypothetical protein n=1 Tax=Nostoc sp. DedQUE07 TaxID=3075392 RepID=UPI002AD45F97|nr:hypothetical protein [Nostoc sp. DedQUE07]MDZ8131892.1 hypothetical protein [Nostoc sp. DedQUE07]